MSGGVENMDRKSRKFYKLLKFYPHSLLMFSFVANFEITAETVGDCQSSTRTIVEAN